MKIYTDSNILVIEQENQTVNYYTKGDAHVTVIAGEYIDIQTINTCKTLISGAMHYSAIKTKSGVAYTSAAQFMQAVKSFITTNSVAITSPKLFFGDNIAVTQRVTSLSEKWAQGLPLGLATMVNGTHGYWELIRDENNNNYFDGISEVGIREGAPTNEIMLIKTDKPNRYKSGHLSYFGYTIGFNTDQANAGFELLVGAMTTGAKSLGLNGSVKDGMLWGCVSDDGINKRFVFRVYKNFTITNETEFKPNFNTSNVTIFEQLVGYYGIHPALLFAVIQDEDIEIRNELVYVQRFMGDRTSISDPNLSMGVLLKNKGNTGNIYMRNGSIEFGNYDIQRDNIDPTARDISYTINQDASISIDPDYTDGSGLLGAFTVPDVISMVSKIEDGVITFSEFTNTITNRLYTIEAIAESNKPVFVNINVLPKEAVTLNNGADYTQINPGRNVLAFAAAVDIDTIDFTTKIDATISRQINSFVSLNLEGVGGDLSRDLVAVVSLSSPNTTTASNISITFITKDLF